ncbi:testis-expressed protein 26-like [Brienomyrus brachyistius]|uniref:testis-expressed protein 26-like n=1 Tax=Brienomyrus brachyistius TaxID=42636 RepID=UPI0020B2EF98|nr:testis-expressed protein 26-like [Brienomyrus brachyistius]
MLMAAFDNEETWDPYETTQRREFVYRPNTPIIASRPMTSTIHRGSHWATALTGSTAYSEDFCWKSASKPICKLPGTASGNRRNNPHPNKDFMVWRLPRGFQQSSADGRSPWRNPLSEQEIRNALSAQYRSTYKVDYLGIHPGFQMKYAVSGSNSQGQDVPYCLQTEMRDSYRQPQKMPELKNNTSRYGCNPLHNVCSKGIVPTVIPANIRNQENSKQLTTYDVHFGGKTEDIYAVLSSLEPKELQKFSNNLPEKDRKVLQAILQRDASDRPVKMAKTPLTISQGPCRLDRLSRWTGPQ